VKLKLHVEPVAEVSTTPRYVATTLDDARQAVELLEADGSVRRRS